MAKKNRDTGFDDGLVSRSQQAAYSTALLQMAAPKSKKSSFLAKLMVWSFVISMPTLILLTLLLTNANRSLNTELAQTLETQYNPSFRVRYDDMGAEIIAAWYAKETPPINVDASVQWTATGASTLTGGTQAETAVDDSAASIEATGISFLRGSQIETKGHEGRYEERLEYYASLNGVPHIIGVTIAIPNLEDMDSVPTLLSAPAIIGKPAVSVISNDIASTPVNELGQANLTEASKSALDTWAKAWTEDNSASLKQTTQDADPDNVYRGIGGGWAYVPNSVQIQWSALAPNGGGDAVARVTWQMRTPSTVIPADEGQEEQTIPGAIQQQTMDVLIGKFESGSPAIIAWDQPGTYMELVPQYNALSAEEAATVAPPAGGAGTETETDVTAPATEVEAPAADQSGQ